jgi:hypothetical protein
MFERQAASFLYVSEKWYIIITCMNVLATGGVTVTSHDTFSAVYI